MSQPSLDRAGVEALSAMMLDIADWEPGERFLGWPDRWYESLTVRCVNGHVSHRTLKTDAGNVCLGCYQPVWLTFPEDVDDPDCDARGTANKGDPWGQS